MPTRMRRHTRPCRPRRRGAAGNPATVSGRRRLDEGRMSCDLLYSAVRAARSPLQLPPRDTRPAIGRDAALGCQEHAVAWSLRVPDHLTRLRRERGTVAQRGSEEAAGKVSPADLVDADTVEGRDEEAHCECYGLHWGFSLTTASRDDCTIYEHGMPQSLEGAPGE
jgi:hypothetical protein